MCNSPIGLLLCIPANLISNEPLGIQRPQCLQTRRLLRMAAHIKEAKFLADTISYGIPTVKRLVGQYALQVRPGIGALSAREEANAVP